jgi:L-fucose mutarotase
MLKNIPSILSPELLKVLMEMGHGDEIVLADGNFPASSHNARVVRADGHGVPDLLEAILTLMPLDTYVEKQVAVMAVVKGDPVPEIWDKFKTILKPYKPVAIETMERFAFYERAKKAYAVIASGETAIYANIILKKGVVSKPTANS